jgi:DNA-binding FrmR family transcriptional regulator
MGTDYPSFKTPGDIYLTEGIHLDSMGIGTPAPWVGVPEQADGREAEADMQDPVRSEVLRRLRFVEGHLEGVRRMIEKDEYCVDILRQTHAVRKAIEKVEAIMLEGHLRTCVVEGMRDGRQDQVVNELMDLYAQANR